MLLIRSELTKNVSSAGKAPSLNILGTEISTHSVHNWCKTNQHEFRSADRLISRLQAVGNSRREIPQVTRSLDVDVNNEKLHRN